MARAQRVIMVLLAPVILPGCATLRLCNENDSPAHVFLAGEAPAPANLVAPGGVIERSIWAFPYRNLNLVAAPTQPFVCSVPTCTRCSIEAQPGDVIKVTWGLADGLMLMCEKIKELDFSVCGYRQPEG